MSALLKYHSILRSDSFDEHEFVMSSSHSRKTSAIEDLLITDIVRVSAGVTVSEDATEPSAIEDVLITDIARVPAGGTSSEHDANELLLESATSFPFTPQCDGIHCNEMFQPFLVNSLILF